MRKLGALVVVVSLLFTGAAGAEPPPYGIVHVEVPPGTSLVEYGEQLYGGNCATCHGSRGVGVATPAPDRGAGSVPGQGPSLRGVGALAADFYLRTGYMPLATPSTQPSRSRVLFSERELDALVAYVASLGDGPPVPEPNPARGSVSQGQSLFTSHCAGCHQAVAEGGYVTGARVPPLDRASPVEIAEAIRIGPYVMPSFGEQDLSEREVDSIVAYVLYAQDPEDPGGWALGHLGPIPEGLVAWLFGAGALVATCVLIGKRLRGGVE